MMTWFSPARLGLFYHWGLFTGGGSSESGGSQRPLRYPTPADLAAAAPDADAVAANLIDTAVRIGARYVTFTVLHTCEMYCAMYPTRVPAFALHTQIDYVGALVRAGQRAGVRVLCYLPAGGPPGDPAGAWKHGIPAAYCNDAAYEPQLKALITELHARYGDGIAGFWLDGNNPAWGIGPHIRRLWPDAIIIGNNDTGLMGAEVDAAGLELVPDLCEPRYNRPDAYRKAHPQWFIFPAKRDFMEDIPTPNAWWHGAPHLTERQLRASPYATDPTHLVKEMSCTLGQRGQWNYTLGLGPCVDGTPPELFRPMLDNLAAFMAWAAPAIHDTTGGEGSQLQPGWSTFGGFYSVTVSHADPSVHYVLVTEVPHTERLHLQTDGYSAASVTDLRTGQAVPFTNTGMVRIEDTSGWDDVARYGARVLRVQMNCPQA
jgi:alpha-L-fucosidase